MQAELFRCCLCALLLGGDDTPMLTEAVAVYFRELREGRGFTQESLANAVGIGKRTIERLERNEGDISVEPFERIITILGASPEEVNYLATNPSATIEEGKEFARILLQEPTPRSGATHPAVLRQDVGSVGIRTYIRTLREQQGIGRKALAEGIGIRIGMLADWEDGRISTIPTAALVRAVTYLGATVEDLDRITSASSDHETLGQQLAEARISGATQHRKHAGRDNGTPVPADSVVLRRIVALEGLVHAVLMLLKRALPNEIEEIERLSRLWFQTLGGSEQRP